MGVGTKECIELYLEKHVYDGILPVFVVEKDKQAPVEQPCTLLHLHQDGCKRVAINHLFELDEVGLCYLKLLLQDLRGNHTPVLRRDGWGVRCELHHLSTTSTIHVPQGVHVLVCIGR